MLARKSYTLFASSAMAAILAMPSYTQAAEVTVDGSNYATLSAAVNFVQGQDDGPHVINIAVDALPTQDGEVVITEPMTINGDFDGNGTKCDLLADVATIQGVAYVSLGQAPKAYIEIQAEGDVTINDLKIHPNADGAEISPESTDTVDQLVDGIVFFRPETSGTLANYTLNRVWVSGSNDANEYVDLQTADDLYDSVATKKWSDQDGGAHAVVQLTKGPAGTALGLYNATLNNCHAGLGKGAALGIPAEGGTFIVNGGLYGHSGQDGIRITGDGVTLTGSPTDRLRVVRVPCVSGGNAHGVEFESNAKVDLVEYVDVATINTGQNFKGQGRPRIDQMRFCRALGKYTDTNNAIVYLDNNPRFFNVEDCTFVGAGAQPNPLQTRGNFQGVANFTDCIFTSENLGTLIINSDNGAGAIGLTNCALPTDNETSESLGTPSLTGGDTAIVTQENIITASPQYLLTRDDYDWTDEQGALDPLNGAGNFNVLRPSNLAYATAASGSTPLTGGAGADLSGIDSSMWMLME